MFRDRSPLEAAGRSGLRCATRLHLTQPNVQKVAGIVDMQQNSNLASPSTRGLNVHNGLRVVDVQRSYESLHQKHQYRDAARVSEDANAEQVGVIVFDGVSINFPLNESQSPRCRPPWERSSIVVLVYWSDSWDITEVLILWRKFSYPPRPRAHVQSRVRQFSSTLTLERVTVKL